MEMKTKSQSRRDRIRLVTAASIGNFLEFFDFGIYSFFAIIIGELFFVSADPAVSLLLSVSVFGVGFLMRPLGSIILGAYADRHGRKSAMLVTIMFMAAGSACITFAPTYASIGLSASAMIVIGRLLQGFSAGGEVGAATTLLVESAGEKQKGFFVCCQYVTQALASLTSAAFGAFLFWALPKEQLYAWGWRIPFIFALLIVPVGLYIRRHIEDTFKVEDIQAAESRKHPLREILGTRPLQFIASIGMVIPGTIMVYTVLKYMPIYLQKLTAITPSLVYLAVMAGFFCQAVGYLCGGLLYDRLVCRKRFCIIVLLTCTVLVTLLFTSINAPYFFFPVMFITAFCMGLMSPMATTLIVEAFPKEVRTTAMAVSYSIGVALFGGTAQVIVTWLITVSGGNPMAPLWYLLPMMFVGMLFYILFQEKNLRRECHE